MRPDNAWERIGDRAKRYAASAMIRLARGILLGSRKLHQAELMNWPTQNAPITLAAKSGDSAGS